MNYKTIDAKVRVMNLPEKLTSGYMVARCVDSELWYYGTYNSYSRACVVVCEFENGVILEVEA